ncbi:hypothetical protein ACWDLG_19435 [Nonomuraea sp. NPDC003727]
MRKQLTLAGTAAVVALTGCASTAAPSAAPAAESAPASTAPARPDPVCAELKKFQEGVDREGAPDVVGLVLQVGDLSAGLLGKTKNADLIRALTLNTEVAGSIEKSIAAGDDPNKAFETVQTQIDESDALIDKVCGKI